MTFPCLVWHLQLGLCQITKDEVELQRLNAGDNTIFINSEGESLEVTRDLVHPEWTPVTIAPPRDMEVFVRSQDGTATTVAVNVKFPPEAELWSRMTDTRLDNVSFRPRDWMPKSLDYTPCKPHSYRG